MKLNFLVTTWIFLFCTQMAHSHPQLPLILGIYEVIEATCQLNGQTINPSEDSAIKHLELDGHPLMSEKSWILTSTIYLEDERRRQYTTIWNKNHELHNYYDNGSYHWTILHSDSLFPHRGHTQEFRSLYNIDGHENNYEYEFIETYLKSSFFYEELTQCFYKLKTKTKFIP